MSFIRNGHETGKSREFLSKTRSFRKTKMSGQSREIPVPIPGQRPISDCNGFYTNYLWVRWVILYYLYAELYKGMLLLFLRLIIFICYKLLWPIWVYFFWSLFLRFMRWIIASISSIKTTSKRVRYIRRFPIMISFYRFNFYHRPVRAFRDPSGVIGIENYLKSFRFWNATHSKCKNFILHENHKCDNLRLQRINTGGVSIIPPILSLTIAYRHPPCKINNLRWVISFISSDRKSNK